MNKTVTELPNRPLLPWQQKAATMRLSGVSRREIALELEVSLSAVALLFSEKARETYRQYNKKRCSTPQYRAKAYARRRKIYAAAAPRTPEERA